MREDRDSFDTLVTRLSDATDQGSSPVTAGYRNLYSAIIIRAILDKFGAYVLVEDLASYDKPLAIEAHEWLFGLDSDAELTCEDCCTVIGVSVEALRDSLVKLEAQELGSQRVRDLFLGQGRRSRVEAAPNWRSPVRG